LLNPLVQGLQNPCVHRRNHINRRIEFFLGHARFPCVRKAAVHSRIAEPHHRDGKANEHFLAICQALHGVSIAIKSSKIGFLQDRPSCD
jgi:hypothetical protein